MSTPLSSSPSVGALGKAQLPATDARPSPASLNPVDAIRTDDPDAGTRGWQSEALAARPHRAVVMAHAPRPESAVALLQDSGEIGWSAFMPGNLLKQDRIPRRGEFTLIQSEPRHERKTRSR